MTRHHRVLAALVILGALAACAGEGIGSGVTVPEVTPTNGSDGPDAPDPSTTTSFTATSLPPLSDATSSMPGNPIDPTLPLVQAAVQDLARRLGTSTENVTVVEALAVTWPDGSLGCPEPGMAYPQVQVDGALVVLEAGGRRYEYHGGDPLVLCEQAK
ncbi:MAG: hypothetical protein ACRDX9_13045 [Acidimicrobiia bacterium]